MKVESDEFYIHLNKEDLNKGGKELIRNCLVILQSYKSSDAADLAAKFYNELSQVGEFFLKVRQLVIKKKKPGRIELKNNF